MRRMETLSPLIKLSRRMTTRDVSRLYSESYICMDWPLCEMGLITSQRSTMRRTDSLLVRQRGLIVDPYRINGTEDSLDPTVNDRQGRSSVLHAIVHMYVDQFRDRRRTLIEYQVRSTILQNCSLLGRLVVGTGPSIPITVVLCSKDPEAGHFSNTSLISRDLRESRWSRYQLRRAQQYQNERRD